jgi:hypothetical protein
MQAGIAIYKQYRRNLKSKEDEQEEKNEVGN